MTVTPSKGKGPVKKEVQISMSTLWTRIPQIPTPSLDKEVERHYTFSEKTGQFPRSAHSLQTWATCTPHMLQGNQSISWGSWPTASASGASRNLGLAGRAAGSWGEVSALWITAAEQVQPTGVRLWRKEAGKDLHQPSFQSHILSQNYLQRIFLLSSVTEKQSVLAGDVIFRSLAFSATPHLTCAWSGMPRHSGPQNDLLSRVSQKRTTWGPCKQTPKQSPARGCVFTHRNRGSARTQDSALHAI